MLAHLSAVWRSSTNKSENGSIASMDIEDLSKSQLLLLTILVNFVVSIATGVMTVSLLDQAPTTVTQTVNRIVDHTIETVTTQVPVIGSSDQGPTTEELLTSAIAATNARTITFLRSNNDEVLGTGLYLFDAKAVVTVSDTLPASLRVRFADGTIVAANKGSRNELLARYEFETGASVPSAPPARLTALADLKQGQTVIALSSDGSAVTGILSKVEEGSFRAELPGVPMGAPAVNLSGAVIGIYAGGGVFYSTERIAALPPES